MADRAARNKAWAHFWTSDRVASCVPASAATEDEINQRWRDFFAARPANSRVLDIATGNGVLLRQAAAAEHGETFELVGIDLADIDPLANVPGTLAAHPSVRFIGGTDAASLPFKDASFDIVVSQYGLEYADLDAALGEVERVLGPGGTLRWLAHSEQSEVVMQNREQHRQVDLLLAANGPLECMDQLVKRLKRGKSPGLAMTRLDKSMRAAEAFCREHPPAHIVVEVCSGLADTANRWQAYDPNDLDTMVKNSRHNLRGHRQRILDLGDAVVTPERLSRIRERLEGAAWDAVDIETMTAGSGGPIGLIIEATRSDRAADER